MSAHVTVTREEGDVVLVRIARPEKKNALTGAMYGAMTEALAGADRERAGAVVLTGSGGSFTAGNDIADFLAAGERRGDLPASLFVKQLARTETPLVAAIEGPAVGIGTTLILHCDLVYAAPSARFRMPFVDLGLVPEAGSTYLLPRRVGMAKAAELALLAEPFDGAEALRLGLVNGLVEADELLGHALAQARRLAAKPRSALAVSRRLLRGDRTGVEAAIAAETDAFGECLRSPEAKAAFRSFLQRAPGG